MLKTPLFRFVRDDHEIPFLKGGTIGLITSAILSTMSIILFCFVGLNLGLDFKGGTILEIHTPKIIETSLIKSTLQEAHIETSTIQKLGNTSDYRIAINLSSNDNASSSQVSQSIENLKHIVIDKIPNTQILQADAVGASVSSELFRNGLLALFFSLAMIMIYIWIRFERDFAISAVITLILDLTKTIGFLCVFRFEFDLVMIAALLTILGYSTNDKVVVYDRIRENLTKYKKKSFQEILNQSINETLNRTLGTSMTVFLAALPLALFGGSTLTGFATVMLVGIVIGTSSSIFIAAPLLLFLRRYSMR